MQWSIPAEGLGYNRAYSFAYDGLNRLTAGNYAGGTAGAYNETFGYDKMGNITNFVRYGLQSTTPGVVYSTIDDLKLDHTGNQLTTVTEKSYGKYLSDNIYCGDEEFVPNLTNTGNSCAYDANGNRLYDSDANVWAIKYNVLNLPDAMQFYQGHQTYYTYTAAGTKLKVIDKMAPEGTFIPASGLNAMASNITFNATITTDYDGSYIYQNDTLKMVLLPEGYWQKGSYYYYLKDHLGSNRVVINGSGTVVETSSYYPSGMRFGESVVSGGSVQPYRHIGKEMQSMHGLNWYDNGARMRQVDIPVWTTLDPLAEKYYSISPYAYCADNPVKFIDSNGKDIDIWYPTDNGGVASFRFNGSNANQAPKNSYVQDVVTAYNYDVNNGGGDNLKEAATNDKLLINVSPTWVGSDRIDYYSSSENTIHWDSRKALQSVGGLRFSPATILEHEMDHAVARNKDAQGFINRARKINDNGNAEEDRVMSGSERKTAISNGEIKRNQKRVDHNHGLLYPVNNPISTKPDYIQTNVIERINYWLSVNPNIQITVK